MGEITLPTWCDVCAGALFSLAMTESNLFRYAASDVDTARAIILTPEAGISTAARWIAETRALVDILTPWLPPGGTMLDFGMGIGRVSGAILARRPDVRVLGVESSPNMRRLAEEYLGPHPRIDVQSDLSGVPEESCDLAIAIYVLQHVSAGLLGNLIRDVRRTLRVHGGFYVLDATTRCVPKRVEAESTVANGDPSAINQVLRRIAEGSDAEIKRELPWLDDGVSVSEAIRETFGDGEVVPLPHDDFGERTRATHHSVVFTKCSERPARQVV